MNAIDTFEDVLTKPAKNLSIENRKRAVDALCDLLREDNGVKEVVKYLFKFHYTVCQAFIEEISSSASDDDTFAIAESFVQDEQFEKRNGSFMYPKGFVAVLAFAGNGKYRAAFLVLNRILKLAEKSGNFSAGCLNNFKKLVVKERGLPRIKEIQTQIETGAVDCSESEKERIARLLREIDNQAAAQKGDSVPVAVIPAVSPDKVEAAQREILAALRVLADNRSAVDTLTALLNRKDTECASIRSEISEKERQIATLGLGMTNRDKRIAETEAQIVDLTERLRKSFQGDEISKKQEAMTLRNDIAEALKSDYADFVESQESPYSQDLFEAYRFMLTRIFKWLKKYGISCQ